MTERDWLAAEDPQGLLDFVGERITPRKVRLFAVACCRTLESELTTSQAVALRNAERHADGGASDDELMQALLVVLQESLSQLRATNAPALGHLPRAVHAALYLPTAQRLHVLPDSSGGPPQLVPDAPTAFEPYYNCALYASIYVAQGAAAFAGVDESTPAQETLLRRVFLNHARILRSIVGNPFHPIDEAVAKVSRSTPSIKLLAAEIYLTSSFYRVPQLAELLREHGVKLPERADQLQSGPHVKGSWLVDLALGIG